MRTVRERDRKGREQNTQMRHLFLFSAQSQVKNNLTEGKTADSSEALRVHPLIELLSDTIQEISTYKKVDEPHLKLSDIQDYVAYLYPDFESSSKKKRADREVRDSIFSGQSRQLKAMTDDNYRLALYIESLEDSESRKLFQKIYPKSYCDILYGIGDRLKDREKSKDDNTLVKILEHIIRLPVVPSFPQDIALRIKNLKENVNNFPETQKRVIKEIGAHVVWLIDRFRSKRYTAERPPFPTLKKIAEDEGLNPAVLLLVGPPGTGKTYIAEYVAEYLGLPYCTINCANTTHISLAGLSRQWGGADVGAIANLFLTSKRFPAVFIFDEVDKAGRSNDNSVIDTISSIIDPLTVFKDEFLEVKLYHLKCCIFVLTANDITLLPDYIIDRATIISFDEPIDYHKMIGSFLSEYEFNCSRWQKELKEFFNRADIIDTLATIFRNGGWSLRKLRRFLGAFEKRLSWEGLNSVLKLTIESLYNIFFEEINYLGEKLTKRKRQTLGFI